MSVAAVVFDFDGVLANSEPLHLDGLRAALATRGFDVPTEDYYERFLGYNDEDALAAMVQHYGWPLTADDIAHLVRIKLQHMVTLLASPGVLYPEAASCVRRLAESTPVAIASGAKRDEIELVLRSNGLNGHFQCIVASGETPLSKPAPDPYARAVELLQRAGAVSSEDGAVARCVAVEDSRWGITSAKTAGLCCIGITTSYPAAELTDADLVIGSLSELTMTSLARVVGDRR